MRDTPAMSDTPAMRLRIGLVSIVAMLALSACGSAGSPAASRPAPPEPIVVSAYVSSGQVRVSPSRFGAGPVLLTITNQSNRAVALRVLRRGRAIARTAPINPQGVTQLKVDLSRGSYSLAAAAAGRRTDAQKTLPSHAVAARLRVGRQRPSSGGSLLQP
jgi:antitoxin (DNA-binding transcriptional repressor) of toxin-antitoxin stability system